MANKITTVIDFVTTGAQRSVKTFRQSISEAEGGLNKFKAGASSAMSAVSANLGNLALAGGAAAVVLGTKVVNAFQETALEAGKLAEATGLTVESASRLREVAADVGVSSETLTSVVKKMTVEIGKGNPLLDEYGIALQRTSDGAADVNATLLDTIRRIGDIQDPTKRAAAAQAAFGRGYVEAAELIFQNADELQRKLDDVSDSKIITDEELANAREFRDTMEELKDVGEDLGVSLGQTIVPVLSDLAEVLIQVRNAVSEAREQIESAPGGKSFLDTAFSGIPDIIDDFQTNARNLGEGLGLIEPKAAGASQSLDRFKDSVLETAPAVGDLEEEAADAADEVVDLGDKAANVGPKIGDMAGALDEAEQHLADLNEQARENALDTLAAAIQGVGDALDEAFGDLESDLGQLDLLDDIEDQFLKIEEAAKDANDPQGVRDLNREIRRLQDQLLDLLQTRKDLKPDQIIEFIARIRTGDVDTLKATLADLTKDLFVNVHINPPTPGFTSGNVDFNPLGGTLSPTFNGVTQPVDNRNITIIYPVGSTPTTQYIDGAIDQRRNGTRNPNLI